jgi:hypothetical protein
MTIVYGIRYDDSLIRDFFEEKHVTICVDDIQIPITIEDDLIYLTDSVGRNAYDARNARDMTRVIKFLKQIGSVTILPSIYVI